MSTHFSALGFSVASSDQLDELVRHVLEDSEAVERSDGGTTHIRGTSSRAAVAVQRDANRTITCVAPFISPTERQRAVYAGTLPSPDCEHCTPLLVDLAGEDGKAVQVAFVTPHAIAWTSALEKGTEIEIGLGGIAEKLRVLEDTPDEDAGIDPLGLGEVPPQPAARIVGRVESNFLRHNELGGGAFEWAVVNAGGIRLEIAADPDAMDAPFRQGRWVVGEFRLTGPVWQVLEGGTAGEGDAQGEGSTTERSAESEDEPAGT